MATIRYGEHETVSASLDGQTVGYARRTFGPIFGIPAEAVVNLNGSDVSNDRVIHAGDEIDFTKPVGAKG